MLSTLGFRYGLGLFSKGRCSGTGYDEDGAGYDEDGAGYDEDGAGYGGKCAEVRC